MKKLAISILLLCVALAAYLLWPEPGRPASMPKAEQGESGRAARRARHPRPSEQAASGEVADATSPVLPADEEQGEMAVLAPTGEMFTKLIGEARAKGLLLSSIRALRVVRLRGSKATLEEFLGAYGAAELAVYENHYEWLIPEYEDEKQFGPAGQPFGQRAMRWMGIDETAEDRGKGVRIALLDTAVNLQALSLSSASIKELDLFVLATGKDNTGGHGTMVASLLVGGGGKGVPPLDGGGGVAGCVPSAELLSIPVLNSDGYGSSHDVAQAIVTAVDSGAQIISMSLGFLGSDPLLEMAVDYAASRGVVIVASAGNEGRSESGESTVLYPAAYEDVLAIGAVNATGQRPDFSSTGSEVALVAPGVGLLADDGSDLVSFSGTSASVPCVVGGLAYMMAMNGSLSADKAAQLLVENANDLGLPADDEEYGLGGANVERALNADTPGIVDAAADVAISRTPEGNVEGIYFTAQNRGTEELPLLTLAYSLYDATTGALLHQGERQFEEVAVGGSVSVALKDGEFAGNLTAIVKVRTRDDSNHENNSVTRFLINNTNTNP